jgi:hypothetical protein
LPGATGHPAIHIQRVTITWLVVCVLATPLVADGPLARANGRDGRDNRDSLLLLFAVTESGTDFTNRSYTTYSWWIRNTDSTAVWLPLPRSRLHPASTRAAVFLFRARDSNGWTAPQLADHVVDYEADWVPLAPGEQHQLFAVTFYDPKATYRRVEVSLTYTDAVGRVRPVRLSWSARADDNRLHR